MVHIGKKFLRFFFEPVDLVPVSFETFTSLTFKTAKNLLSIKMRGCDAPTLTDNGNKKKEAAKLSKKCGKLYYNSGGIDLCMNVSGEECDEVVSHSLVSHSFLHFLQSSRVSR